VRFFRRVAQGLSLTIEFWECGLEKRNREDGFVGSRLCKERKDGHPSVR